MIRTFHLRDIPLVRRLSEQGILFHAESALTKDIHPLREAIVHMLIGGQYPTYIWRADGDRDAAGFVQLRQENDETHAHILCLGSTANAGGQVDDGVLVRFLEQLVAEVGRQGIHNLIAEVSEEGEELPILRQAGFAVYTRQDVWRIDAATAKEKIDDHQDGHLSLQRATAVDEWDISLLYANIVPRLIQLVESAPVSSLENAWVLREGDELVAFIDSQDGQNANWLRIYIHPNAQTMGDDIIAAAFRAIPVKPNHPVYCCVRRYQSWVQAALERYGFEYIGSQAMMVRHTVQHTRKLVPNLEAKMQATGVPARKHYFSETEHRNYQLVLHKPSKGSDNTS